MIILLPEYRGVIFYTDTYEMGSLKDQEKLDQRPDMKEAKGSCEHRASTSKGERSVSMPDMNFGRKSVSETEMPGLGSISQPCTKTPAEYTPTKKPAPFVNIFFLIS